VSSEVPHFVTVEIEAKVVQPTAGECYIICRVCKQDSGPPVDVIDIDGFRQRSAISAFRLVAGDEYDYRFSVARVPAGVLRVSYREGCLRRPIKVGAGI
jgi:hypothetical protein